MWTRSPDPRLLNRTCINPPKEKSQFSLKEKLSAEESDFHQVWSNFGRPHRAVVVSEIASSCP